MPEAYYLILSPQAEQSPGVVAFAFASWLRAELRAETDQFFHPNAKTG